MKQKITKSNNLLFYNETSDMVRIINDGLKTMGIITKNSVFAIHWMSKLCTFCLLMGWIQQIFSIIVAKDANEIFECIPIALLFTMSFFKLNSVCNYQNRWRSILTKISNLEKEELNNLFALGLNYYSYSNEDKNRFSDNITIYTKKFKTNATFLKRMYIITASTFMASPFVEYLYWKIKGEKSLNYPHVYRGWAPPDKLGIYFYLFTLLCEVMGCFFGDLIHFVFDVTATGIKIFVSGQSSLLRDYSASIAGKGNVCKLLKKRDERAHFRIKHCHHINMIIIDLIKELDMLLKNVIGTYYIIAALILCCIAIRLRMGDITNMHLVSLFLCELCTLTQLFLYCCYGDALMRESSINMGQGPYACAYWALSPHVRRDLTILSQSMMTPRHLRAGPFNYIDLPSFITVIRAAYSYYAVMGKKSR